MTTKQPGAPTDPLVKGEVLTKKVNDALAIASGVIGKILKEFEAREPADNDPEHLKRMVDSMFASADRLIELAEDTRAIQQRRERILGTRATGEAIKPIETVVIDDTEIQLTVDEQSLLRILKEQETDLSLADFIELGFGLDVSDGIATRKTLFKKTMASLIRKLSSTGTPIRGEGNTRARRYSLEGVVTANEAPESAFEIADDVSDEPETKEVVATPAIDVFAHLRDPMDELNEEFRQRVVNGVTLTLAQTTQPIIHIRSIIRRSFENPSLTTPRFRMVTNILRDDERLEYIGKGEYAVIGRDRKAEWIDDEALLEIADKIIRSMHKAQERTLSSESIIARASKIKEEGLTSSEVERLLDLLRNDPRIEDSLSRSVIRLKVLDPTSGVPIALDPELEEKISQAHIGSATRPRRRG
jgi:hypothetical protein